MCRNLAQKHNLTVTASTVQADKYVLDPDDEGPINFRDSKERLVASVEAYLRISPENRKIIGIGEVA